MNLIVLLILLLLIFGGGGFYAPAPYHTYSGSVGIILLVCLILVLMGRL